MASAQAGPVADAAGRTRGISDTREMVGVSALALLALGLRLLHWQNTSVMFNDGPRFLIQAAHFAQGEWRRALGDAYHPLYAFVVACAQLAFGPAEPGPADWERAAVGVSAIAGVAAVVVFYAFLRSAFGQPAAWIGAALLACNPYSVEFSSDVQSDGLYQAMFLGGVAFAWAALRDQRASLAGWAGVCAGLAYLTRPEGLGVAAAAAAVAWLQVLLRRWRLRTAIPWSAALVCGVLIVTGPYLVALRVNAGEWTLTQKKSLRTLAGMSQDLGVIPSVGLTPGAEIPFTPEVMQFRHEHRQQAREEEWERTPPAPPDRGRQALDAAGELLHTVTSAIRPEIVLFALVGLLVVRGRPGLRGQLMLAVVAVYWAADWALAYTYGYLSRRHTLAPALLLIGYAAAAVPVLGAAAARLVRRPLNPRRVRLATSLVLLLLVGLALGKVMRPQRAANAAEREAAEWIRALPEPVAGPVAAGKRRVAYYAGAPWFPLRKMPEGASLVAALRSNGVRYVVADEKDVQAYPDLVDPQAAGLTVRHHVEHDGGSATVFELPRGEGG
jgi:4-amino-4-deoxy-L-arabinose transferase-like glycosyltransferase